MTADRTIHFLGNNEATVLVSREGTDDAYCVMELVIQPGGGANALHVDRWTETFHLIEGEVDWTLERDGELVTWRAKAGETVVVPPGMRHRFAGAGHTPSRMLTIGPGEYERFFRALADAWQGPYDRDRTPAAVGPVFEAFGMRMASAT